MFSIDSGPDSKVTRESGEIARRTSGDRHPPRPWDHGAESSIIFAPRAADPCSSGSSGRSPWKEIHSP